MPGNYLYFQQFVPSSQVSKSSQEPHDCFPPSGATVSALVVMAPPENRHEDEVHNHNCHIWRTTLALTIAAHAHPNTDNSRTPDIRTAQYRRSEPRRGSSVASLSPSSNKDSPEKNTAISIAANRATA
jgi:hypothetical protein